MWMFGMTQSAVVDMIERDGGQILEIQPDAQGADVEYWVTKPSSRHH